MKLKLGTGEGGIKGLVGQHIEKVVLGVVAVLVIMVVLSSVRRPGLKDELKPTALSQVIASANSKIQNSKWEDVRDVRYPQPDDHVTRAQKSSDRTDPSYYQLSKGLNVPLFEKKAKRPDPVLFAAVSPKTEVGLGALAYNPKSPVVAKSLPATTTTTPAPAHTGGSPSSEPVEGFIASGEAIARGTNWVSFTALIPVGKQREEYRSKFEQAEGYLPEHNEPKIFDYEVERCEVLPGGKTTPWVKIGDQFTADEEAARDWAGLQKEVVEERDLPAGLIMPLPPVLLQAIDRWAARPEVRLIPKAELAPDAASSKPANLTERRPLRLPGRGAPGTASAPRPGTEGTLIERNVKQSDMVLFRYFDFKVEPGKSYQYRVRLYLEDANDPLGDAAKQQTGGERMSQFSERSLTEDAVKRIRAKRDKEARRLLEEARTILTTKPATRDGLIDPQTLAYVVDLYKKIQWLGSTYGPNDKYKPEQLRAALKPLINNSQELDKPWEGENPCPLRETEWSEPSPVATIEKISTKYLAGQVTPGTETIIPGTPIRLPKTEATGSAFTLLWDPAHAAYVAGSQAVSRGTILNSSQTVNVLDPITRSRMPVADYSFQTDAVVVDLRGGENLSVVKKPGVPAPTAVQTPGEVLLMDRHGKLISQNEMDDLPLKIKLLPPADTPADAGPGAIPKTGPMPGGGLEDALKPPPKKGA